MKHLILFFLARPTAVFIAFMAIAVGGALSLSKIPVDFLPYMEVPRVTVATSFEGLPAGDIRELITIPLEDALSGLEGLRKIRSYSRDGTSLIQILMEWGVNPETAALQVREIIDVAYLSLPSQASKPLVLPVDPSETPVILLGVFPKTDLSLVRQMTRREIRSALQQVQGVGSIQVFGGQRDMIEVMVDQSLISRTGADISVIAEAINRMNAEYPSGSLDDGDMQYIIKADGRQKSWQDIANISIAAGESGPVLVRDVAKVERKPDRHQAFLLSGNREGIAVSIRRNRGFSPVALSENLYQKIDMLNRAYSGDLQIQVLYDQSQEITVLINRLVISGLTGMMVAFLVLLLFLRHMIYALITVTAIPLSILGAILMMGFMGISFNIMSLGGLTLGVGMLVDNAVVVLENLLRRARPDSRMQIAQAAGEITDSTLGSTLTSIVVFLPLLFFPGLLGSLFSDLAWAIVLALSFSFLVSAIWVPLLFSHLKRRSDQSSYLPPPLFRLALRRSLRFPVLGLMSGVAVLLLTAILLPSMGFVWLQPTRQSRIEIMMRFKSGTTVEHSLATSREIIKTLESQNGIRQVVATGGGNLNDPYFLVDPSQSVERTDFMVFIDPKSHWTPEAIGRMTGDLLPSDVVVEANFPPDFISRVLDFSQDTARLLVKGDDPDQAVHMALSLNADNADKMGNDIQVVPRDKKPQLRLFPDRQAMSHHKLDLTRLASIVGIAINGQIVSTFEENGRRIPIRVRLKESDRQNRKALEQVSVLSSDTGRLKLSEVVTLSRHEDYPVLYREDRSDVAYLFVPSEKASTIIANAGDLLSDPQAQVRKDQRRAIVRLFLISAGLLYVLLGMQFNSIWLPVLFLLTQPIAVAGGILLIRLHGLDLNINSVLGLLVILGISINNALLLYEQYRQLQKDGLPAAQIVYGGTLNRLRPIMITGCTTIAALLPLILDVSGQNPQKSLALAVVGGITFSIPTAIFGLSSIFCGYFGRMNRKNP